MSSSTIPTLSEKRRAAALKSWEGLSPEDRRRRIEPSKQAQRTVREKVAELEALVHRLAHEVAELRQAS